MGDLFPNPLLFFAKIKIGLSLNIDVVYGDSNRRRQKYGRTLRNDFKVKNFIPIWRNLRAHGIQLLT